MGRAKEGYCVQSPGHARRWWDKVSHKLVLRSGTLTSWRFWAVQALVAVVVAAHRILEIASDATTSGRIHLVPEDLLLAPVIYAAWAFGFAGAGITALFTVAISVLPQGGLPWWEISEVAVIALTALLVGFLVDEKIEAHDRARLYANHALRSREDERVRVSRDLHDDTIQKMVMVCRRLDGVRYFSSPLPAAVSDELLGVRTSVEEIASDLRRFARDLRPATLDELGPVASIRQHLAGLANRTGADARLEMVGAEQELPPEVGTGVFRIAQEALQNVERHAQANKVLVTVVFSGREVALGIKDNGVGFTAPQSPAAFASSGRLGVLGMFEHADLLGGRLEVKSKPGGGTTVRAFIPLDKYQARSLPAGPAPGADPEKPQG